MKSIILDQGEVKHLLDNNSIRICRPIEPRPDHFHWGEGFRQLIPQLDNQEIQCSYGKPGDRLWVKEEWVRCLPIISAFNSDERPYIPAGDMYAAYRADGFDTVQDYKDYISSHSKHEVMIFSDYWKPAETMPCYFSRLVVEIVSIGVNGTDWNPALAWEIELRRLGKIKKEAKSVSNQ
jgi:hypothetical protein